METAQNYKPKVEVVSDADSLARRSLEIFVGDAEKALKDRNKFHVAISGGHTPKHFFELLGTAPQSRALTWEEIHLFWVDERYVSRDSQWSNYKLAADAFLGRVGIPEENIHPIPTEYDDFKEAARLYEETIRNVFALDDKQLPVFDLIMLGMGADGHTGSLFPNSYASFDKDDIACVVYVLEKKLNRITLTHPVLCAASHLAVMVSGQEKAAALKDILTREADEVQYPIHALWPVLDKVTWLVDKNAAKFL